MGAPQSTAPQQETLLPAFLIGIAAGLIGSLVLVLLNPTGTIGGVSIYAGASFVAALAAVQFAPSNLLEVWGLLFVGVALGVFLSVLIHPMLGSGERNLWPFEVVMFGGVGIIPAWLGLFLGRFLNARRKRGLERAV